MIPKINGLGRSFGSRDVLPARGTGAGRPPPNEARRRAAPRCNRRSGATPARTHRVAGGRSSAAVDAAHIAIAVYEPCPLSCDLESPPPHQCSHAVSH